MQLMPNGVQIDLFSFDCFPRPFNNRVSSVMFIKTFAGEYLFSITRRNKNKTLSFLPSDIPVYRY